MKLFYSKTSPFARKVRVATAVLGLQKKLDLIQTDVFNNSDSFKHINPLIKIPALEMDSGEVLVNSPFICQYLSTLTSGQMLFPIGPELWSALNFQAIADGGADAAVLRRMEGLRSPDKREPKFESRQNEKIENALHFCQKNIAQLSKQNLGIAEISVICFVDYLSFRFGYEHWDSRFSRLFDWVNQWNSCNSALAETRPA